MKGLLSLALVATLVGCATKRPPPPLLLAGDLVDPITIRLTHRDSTRSVLRRASLSGDSITGTSRREVCTEILDIGRTVCSNREDSVRYALSSPDLTRMEAQPSGTRAVEGLKFGATTGALAGFLMGYCLNIGSDECSEDVEAGVVVALIVGGAAGVIGLAIGALLPGRWVEVSPTVREGNRGSGLTERTRGSHHIFWKAGIRERTSCSPAPEVRSSRIKFSGYGP